MVKVINTLLVQAERDIDAFFSYNQRRHLIHTPFNLLLHSFRVSSSTKHKQTQPKAKPEVNGRHSIMLLPFATSRAVITHAAQAGAVGFIAQLCCPGRRSRRRRGDLISRKCRKAVRMETLIYQRVKAKK